jgi:hypothetical protein
MLSVWQADSRTGTAFSQCEQEAVSGTGQITDFSHVEDNVLAQRLGDRIEEFVARRG